LRILSLVSAGGAGSGDWAAYAAQAAMKYLSVTDSEIAKKVEIALASYINIECPVFICGNWR